MARWSVQKTPLSPPALKDLVCPIITGLSSNFQDISVSVVLCPDLRQSPFNLAAEGLDGSPRIADIGGPPNLAPLPKLDRKYSLLEMTRFMDIGIKGTILGAPAGPFHVLRVNSELAPNFSYDGEEVTNRTHYAKIDGNGDCLCETISSTDCGLMANLFGSDGNPGNMLKITAKVRTGLLNFTNYI
jgi:hypothetical protein